MNTFLKFGIVGGAGFAVDSGVLFILTKVFGFSPIYSRIVSFILAVIVTWIGNTKFSFRKDSNNLTITSFVFYLTYQSIGLTANFVLYTCLVISNFKYLNDPIVALSIASVFALFLNFFLLKFFHFSDRQI